MFQLDAFTLTDMLLCGAAIRQFGLDSACVEEASEKVVRFIFNNFVTGDSERATVLVRLFKTLRFDELDGELRAQAVSTGEGVPDRKFLTLMASAGRNYSWNDRRLSISDRLIPLADRAHLRMRMPMVAQLLAQLEGDCSSEPAVSCVLAPEQKRFNVSYLPEAIGSPLIVEQPMVLEHGVRSVLGYGGMLHRSSAYCVVIYANVIVPRECADLFQPLALSTKNALIYASDFRVAVGQKLPA